MKRHRVLVMDFDTRAFILSLDVAHEWEPRVKENWINNKKQIIEALVAEYGPLRFHHKVDNFIALGNLP